MEEKRYIHTRIDFDGNGFVIIRRTDGEDGKAVIYTNAQAIKDDLIGMSVARPEVVSILTEDEEGVMQAIITGDAEKNICLVLVPTLGTCEFIPYAD